jgi:hypothetical protein
VNNATNEYTQRLLALADANGWTVLEMDNKSPGYIVLRDTRGTQITIASPYGLDTPFYMEQLKARDATRWDAE